MRLGLPDTYMLAVILQGDDTFTPAVETTAMVEDGGGYSVVATDDFAGGLVLNVDNSANADAAEVEPEAATE